MSAHNVNISSYIDDLVPDHVNQNYPELVEFIKVYTLYLEKENKSSFWLNQLDQQRDIDLIEEHLLTELQNEIGAPIPRHFATDPRLFYKHLVEFYRSRGTKESIKAFFRLIYNDNVDIHYPRVDMLIPSDGRWVSALNERARLTYTIGAASTYVIDGNSDEGYIPNFDGDVIELNGVKLTSSECKELLTYDEVTNSFKHSLSFTNQLILDDVVKVYSRGSFTTNDGFISDTKKIQDSYRYQKFSYVLKTGNNIEDWKNAFTRLIHPAGFIFFGEILVVIDAMAKDPDQWYYGPINNQNYGHQGSGLPININVPPVYATPAADEIGTYVEKELIYSNSPARIGMWNHLENTKFWNWRPIREYGEYTIQDVLSNSIGLQLGARIWSCGPNDITTDTSFESSECTIQT